MRKAAIIGTVMAVIFFTAPVHADNPMTKFGRGMCNIVTFHFEILEQSKRVKAEQGSLYGMTYGLVKGFAMSIVRAAVGVYEVATFPIPYPPDYQPILRDPVSFFPEPKKPSQQA